MGVHRIWVLPMHATLVVHMHQLETEATASFQLTPHTTAQCVIFSKQRRDPAKSLLSGIPLPPAMMKAKGSMDPMAWPDSQLVPLFLLAGLWADGFS